MFQDAIPSAMQTVEAGSTAQIPPEAPLVVWTEIPGVLRRRAGWIIGSLVAALVAGFLIQQNNQTGFDLPGLNPIGPIETRSHIELHLL